MPNIIESVYEIPIQSIHADSDFNCRGPIAPIDVADLVRDIERNGLQSPVLVQEYNPEQKKATGKDWRLIAGYRRLKCFQILKKTAIPALVRAGLSDLDARIMNLNENLQRKNLNMLQEALALKALKDGGLTEDQIAKIIGMSRGWVQIRVMILGLPADIQSLVAGGLFSTEQIRCLHSLHGEEQTALVREIKEAKGRGEKVMPRKKMLDLKSKKPRQRVEIFGMIDEIRRATGFNFGTRTLAWAAGEINTLELYQDIKRYAADMGREFKIPE